MNRNYVLIVNWNGWGDTLECLESLMRLESPAPHVIVCDNGSSDCSLDIIRAWADGALDVYVSSVNPLRRFSYPPVAKPLGLIEYSRMEAENGGNHSIDPQLTLIRIDENLGFAGGNNVGLRYLLARGDFDNVWLLNNDTIATTQSLNGLLSRMKIKPKAGMCGSSLIYYGSSNKIQALGGGYYCKWIGLPWHYARSRVFSVENVPVFAEKFMNYVEGASLLVSRTFLEKIGLLNEEYFLYFEETDWAIRSKGIFELAYEPTSIVYHKVGRSIGTATDPRRKSFMCDYFNVRNRIIFTRKYYPYAIITVYVGLIISMIIRMICGKWKMVIMIAKLMRLVGKETLSCNCKNA